MTHTMHPTGLSLSGGGAKGMVQLGILQYFDEHKVQFDVVSGTSIGSIIGAFYCAGIRPYHIYEFFLETSLFDYKLIGFNKAGLINSQRLAPVLEEALPVKTFEELQRPLRAVACDLKSGKPHIFREGPLVLPLLASSAFPGVFSPVPYQDMLLSDGGILNNFPANIIRGECRHLTGIHLKPINRIESDEAFSNMLDVMIRAYELLISAGARRNAKLCDLMLSPQELAGARTFNVKNEELESLYELGYQFACRYFEKSPEELEELKKLSCPKNHSTP
ncbi:MAG: patatin-like phospholipase family protein [Cytophagales bacterium]|nr:patatin-like phospholipase family protein [Cytophagales bacterium]